MSGEATSNREAVRMGGQRPFAAEMLRGFGGELRDSALEARFQQEKAAETYRHARLVFVAGFILNSLFLLSDWRFHGDPHFWIAVPSRLFVIAVSAFCFGLVRLHPERHNVRRLLIGWMWATALGVGLLVTSHSDIALFVVIMLPSIYFLLVPVPFGWLLGSAVGCAAAMLAGYAFGATSFTTMPGLVMAMLILGTSLTLAMRNKNRLERLQWLATRSERAARDELARSRESFETMFDASPVPLIVTRRDNGRISRINRAAARFIGEGLGRPHAETLIDFYANPTDRDRLLATVDRDGGVGEDEVDVRHADGTIRTVLVRAIAIDDAEGRLIIIGVVDITDRRAAEIGLERLATTDMLTGIPNRLHFFLTGTQMIDLCRQEGEPLSVMMVDLDHFKRINDSLGHKAGDDVLRAFSALASTIVGRRGTVARLGGEEFGVLLPRRHLAQAIRLGERLRMGVMALTVEGVPDDVEISVSIGVTELAEDEGALDAAMIRADKALYAAKRNGRNCVMPGYPVALDTSAEVVSIASRLPH